MMITIEPMELVATSETLRTCSIEAADIGSQLWACSQCPMPSDVQGAVDQLVGAVDRALDSVALALLTQALDLTRRALIAINDSQASTVVVGDPNTTNIGIAGYSPYEGMTITSPDGLTTGWLDPMNEGTITIGGSMTGGWLDPMSQTTSTIGGESLTGGWLDPMALTTSTIGGESLSEGFTITSPSGSPVDTTPWMTTMTIGPPNYQAGPLAGIMALVDAQQNLGSSALTGAAGLGGSPSALKVAMGIQDTIYNNTMHTLSPSRTQLDDQYGYHLSDSYVNMISPFTLPRSPISFT
jgi:hypothetical protein